MTIPRNLDLESLFRTVLPPPEQALDPLLEVAVAAMGPVKVESAKSQWATIEKLMEHEPGYLEEPIETLLETCTEPLKGEVGASLFQQFFDSFKLPQSSFPDFIVVASVLHTRNMIRALKDIRGYGRAYTYFKQVLTLYPKELAVALERRDSLEGQRNQATYNLEDLQLLTQLVRVLDSPRTTDLSQRLADLWWRVYERPVQRFCTLVWFLGQEVKSPGNSKTPPVGSAGELFRQASAFSKDLGITFPFRTDLNTLRNALHRRQTRISLDLSIEFQDSSGKRLALLDFDSLAQSVQDDAEFCMSADNAASHASMAAQDDDGVFDDFWARFAAAIEASGLSLRSLPH